MEDYVVSHVISHGAAEGNADILSVYHIVQRRRFMMKRIDVSNDEYEFLFLHYLQQTRFKQMGFLRINEDLSFHYGSHEVVRLDEEDLRILADNMDNDRGRRATGGGRKSVADLGRKSASAGKFDGLEASVLERNIRKAKQYASLQEKNQGISMAWELGLQETYPEPEETNQEMRYRLLPPMTRLCLVYEPVRANLKKALAEYRNTMVKCYSKLFSMQNLSKQMALLIKSLQQIHKARYKHQHINIENVWVGDNLVLKFGEVGLNGGYCVDSVFDFESDVLDLGIVFLEFALYVLLISQQTGALGTTVKAPLEPKEEAEGRVNRALAVRGTSNKKGRKIRSSIDLTVEAQVKKMQEKMQEEIGLMNQNECGNHSHTLASQAPGKREAEGRAISANEVFGGSAGDWKDAANDFRPQAKAETQADEEQDLKRIIDTILRNPSIIRNLVDSFPETFGAQAIAAQQTQGTQFANFAVNPDDDDDDGSPQSHAAATGSSAARPGRNLRKSISGQGGGKKPASSPQRKSVRSSTTAFNPNDIRARLTQVGLAKDGSAIDRADDAPQLVTIAQGGKPQELPVEIQDLLIAMLGEMPPTCDDLLDIYFPGYIEPEEAVPLHARICLSCKAVNRGHVFLFPNGHCLFCDDCAVEILKVTAARPDIAGQVLIKEDVGDEKTDMGSSTYGRAGFKHLDRFVAGQTGTSMHVDHEGEGGGGGGGAAPAGVGAGGSITMAAMGGIGQEPLGNQVTRRASVMIGGPTHTGQSVAMGGATLGAAMGAQSALGAAMGAQASTMGPLVGPSMVAPAGGLLNPGGISSGAPGMPQGTAMGAGVGVSKQESTIGLKIGGGGGGGAGDTRSGAYRNVGNILRRKAGGQMSTGTRGGKMAECLGVIYRRHCNGTFIAPNQCGAAKGQIFYKLADKSYDLQWIYIEEKIPEFLDSRVKHKSGAFRNTLTKEAGKHKRNENPLMTWGTGCVPLPMVSMETVLYSDIKIDAAVIKDLADTAQYYRLINDHLANEIFTRLRCLFDPSDKMSWMELGRIMFERRNYSAARACYHKIGAGKPATASENREDMLKINTGVSALLQGKTSIKNVISMWSRQVTTPTAKKSIGGTSTTEIDKSSAAPTSPDKSPTVDKSAGDKTPAASSLSSPVTPKAGVGVTPAVTSAVSGAISSAADGGKAKAGARMDKGKGGKDTQQKDGQQQDGKEAEKDGEDAKDGKELMVAKASPKPAGGGIAGLLGRLGSKNKSGSNPRKIMRPPRLGLDRHPIEILPRFTLFSLKRQEAKQESERTVAFDRNKTLGTGTGAMIAKTEGNRLVHMHDARGEEMHHGSLAGQTIEVSHAELSSSLSYAVFFECLETLRSTTRKHADTQVYMRSLLADETRDLESFVAIGEFCSVIFPPDLNVASHYLKMALDMDPEHEFLRYRLRSITEMF